MDIADCTSLYISIHLCISLYISVYPFISVQLFTSIYSTYGDRGEGYQSVDPYLDAAANILITAEKSHCVCILSNEGELIHKFEGEGEFL